MEEARPDFSMIIKDNEQAAAKALQDGNFVQAFLLVHALIEALLRLFLRETDEDRRFVDLVQSYKAYLASQMYPFPEFVDELEKFNRRRNRLIHQLWRKGFSYTNQRTADAAGAAVLVYGLLIEWLETFDPEITQIGFTYGGA